MPELISKLRSLDPIDFEHFVADLWERQGWETEVTKQSGDRGVDVLATKEFPYQQVTALQAKRYGTDTKVSSPEMQKYGALKQRKDIDTVVVVTTNEFTNEASRIAEDYNIKCMNSSVILELIDRLDAQSVVQSYADGGPPANVKTDASGSASSYPDSGSSDGYSATSSLVGAGSYLKLTVTHLDWLEHTFTGEESFCQFPPGLQNQLPIEFSGVALGLSVENVSDDLWAFSPVPKNPSDSAHLRFVGRDGLESEPYMVSQFHTLSQFLSLPHGWSTGPSEVSPNRRIQILELFPLSENTTPRGITYSTAVRDMNIRLGDYESDLSGEREHIEIMWSEKIHESIVGLPPEIDLGASTNHR